MVTFTELNSAKNDLNLIPIILHPVMSTTHWLRLYSDNNDGRNWTRKKNPWHTLWSMLDMVLSGWQRLFKIVLGHLRFESKLSKYFTAQVIVTSHFWITYLHFSYRVTLWGDFSHKRVLPECSPFRFRLNKNCIGDSCDDKLFKSIKGVTLP